MPPMPYVVFAGHVLLGAGDLLPVSVALGLFALSVAFCLTRLVERFAGGTRLQSIAVSRNALVAQAVGGVVTAGLMLLLVTVGVEFLVRAGASEAPTWVILPCAVALLFGSSSRAGWAAGSALVGLWVALRLNDLPAAVFLLGLFCAPRDRRPERVALAAAGLGAFLGAILLHNGVYGGELALVRAEPIVAGAKVTHTDSGLGALGNFLAAITDPAARAEMARHARALLYFPFELRFDLASLAPSVAFHGLQVAWLAAVGWAVARPRRAGLTAGGMLLLPIAVLVPYLVFDVTVYYPRQLVLGYLAMGVAVLFTLGRVTAPRPSPAERSEGPVSTEATAPGRPSLEGRPAAARASVRRLGRPAGRA